MNFGYDKKIKIKKTAPAIKQKLPEKTQCMAFYATALRGKPEDDIICHALVIANYALFIKHYALKIKITFHVLKLSRSPLQFQPRTLRRSPCSPQEGQQQKDTARACRSARKSGSSLPKSRSRLCSRSRS